MRGLLGSSINGVKLILTAILLILNGVKLILTAILLILKLILTASSVAAAHERSSGHYVSTVLLLILN